LKPHHNTLPFDRRNLLKTPPSYNVKLIESPMDGLVNGQYCHLSIGSGIAQLLKSVTPPADGVLSSQFNFDG
jgi:hypothetical protein